MNANPLLQLIEHGQTYWLDNLTRSKIASGELKRRTLEAGLRGITSNPAIFHKAISGSSDYDEQIRRAFAAGRARRCSACCGQAPAPRTRNAAT
jgi:transaldolase